MGFDVCGLEPETKKGEYFRNNVWWWRPLWTYVGDVCKGILTDDDFSNGCMNNCHKISIEKADAIAKVLWREIENGNTKKYSAEYQKIIAKIKIHNKGKKIGDKDFKWGAEYPFSVANVREFAEFVEESGGFAIG